MSKRMVRLSAENMRPTIQSWINLPITVVLQNSLTYFGNLTNISIEGITIQDGRVHEHYFANQEIFEIVFDHLDRMNEVNH